MRRTARTRSAQTGPRDSWRLSDYYGAARWITGRRSRLPKPASSWHPTTSICSWRRRWLSNLSVVGTRRFEHLAKAGALDPRSANTARRTAVHPALAAPLPRGAGGAGPGRRACPHEHQHHRGQAQVALAAGRPGRRPSVSCTPPCDRRTCGAARLLRKLLGPLLGTGRVPAAAASRTPGECFR